MFGLLQPKLNKLSLDKCNVLTFLHLLVWLYNMLIHISISLYVIKTYLITVILELTSVQNNIHILVPAVYISNSW